jgi:hypothetical protein
MVTAIRSDYREKDRVGTLVVSLSELKTEAAHVDGSGAVQTLHETGPLYVGSTVFERGDGQFPGQVTFK